MVYILPHIEQGPIYNKLDLTGIPGNGQENTGIFYMDTINGGVANGAKISTYVCPANVFTNNMATAATCPTGVQRPTYVGIAGGYIHSTAIDYGANQQHAPSGIVSKGGILPLMQRGGGVKFGEITDGTSSTLMVSEQSDSCKDASGALVECRSDHGHTFLMGGADSDHRTWNVTTLRYAINNRTWENVGVGDIYYGQNKPLLSPHGSGVNGLFGDGSVRFLSNTIDLQTLSNLGNRNDGNVLGNY